MTTLTSELLGTACNTPTYDPSKYPAFAVTADIVYTTIHNGQLCVLLIRRGGEPYQGYWALPGGFVEPNETTKEGAVRELLEETGIDINASTSHIEQLKTYSKVNRDPRMRTVSVAYVALVPNVGQVHSGDDASDARFWPVSAVLREDIKLAFDHTEIVVDGIERVRAKLEYSSLACAFCDTKFSIPELRHVYEAVWGIQISAANFRRKVLNTKGLVVAQLEKTEHGSLGGGRRSALYSKGDAREIFPPWRRTDFNRKGKST